MRVGVRRRVRAILLGAVGVLYLVSIPWYRAPGSEAPIAFGLPSWVAVALGCYLAVAVLNAAAWLLTDVPDESADEPDAGES
ncbi:MAG: hypothetical protein HRU01_20275 [Myxococcales bacterium]|nr:hypothetical protein [Myxococcales bacterium]